MTTTTTIAGCEMSELDNCCGTTCDKQAAQAEIDALKAQVQALRVTCNYWIERARPDGGCTKTEFNTWLALGLHSDAMTKSPAACLAPVLRGAYLQGAHDYQLAESNREDFNMQSRSNQYVESVLKGEVK